MKEDWLSTSEAEADKLLGLLTSLQGSLPRVNEAPALAMSNHSSFRIKIGIGAFLLLGILEP